MRSISGSGSARPLRAVAAFVVASLFLLWQCPAQAEPILGGVTGPPGGTFTELQVLPINGSAGATNVDAHDAPSDFDPLSGYPATIPGTWPDHLLGYAGLIPVRDAGGTTTSAYCIDLFTDTQSGVNYERGEWSEANVPNLGFVAYILQNYFPVVPAQPAGVADNLKAAAVQAAIWFFTDNLVVDPTDEPQLHALVSDVVADALENGPAAEPEPPTLSVSPRTADAPSTGELVGPFNVTSNGPSTLRLLGVEVFTDAAGTQELEAGDTVPAGAQLWVRSISPDTPQGFALERELTVLESTVYLYDGSNAGRDNAQKLVLAQPSQLDAVAGVRITPFAAGGIELTKTISGDGAGLQGEIRIRVECVPSGGGAPIERTVTIPAGTDAGDRIVSLTALPAGATCTITEPRDGDNVPVNLTATSIEPGTVTIVEGETTPVAATNEYERAFGALRLTKKIAGPGAGEQGEVVLALDCDDADDAFDQEFTIPARSDAGSYPQPVVRDIPAGTVCTITETSTGTTDTVTLTKDVELASTTIADGERTDVTVTNTYRERDGDTSPDTGTLPSTGASAGTIGIALLGLALLGGGITILTLRRTED